MTAEAAEQAWMDEVDQSFAEWLSENVADAVITEDDTEGNQ